MFAAGGTGRRDKVQKANWSACCVSYSFHSPINSIGVDKSRSYLSWLVCPARQGTNKHTASEINEEIKVGYLL